MNLPTNWREAFEPATAAAPSGMPAFAKSDDPPPPTPAKAHRRAGHRPTEPVTRPLTALELEVLRYTAKHRAVTTFQVIQQFWIANGKSSRHGNRVLRALADRGALTIFPLFPSLGRSSIRVCGLTQQGWTALGEAKPPKDSTALVGNSLHYRLQHVEMLQIREAEGWAAITPNQVGLAVRKLGLDQFRGRVLTGEEQALQSLLHKQGAPAMPCSCGRR